MPLTLGIDLGQKTEPTAFCLAEQVDRSEDVHFVVRHLDRLPAGTPFPGVAERLRDMLESVSRKSRYLPSIYVDATGIGSPVIDLLQDYAKGAYIYEVYFTHGDQRSRENGATKLGKAYLVSQLQVLLQTARLHLPRSSQAEELAQDLLDYQVQVHEKANDTYGAFKVGRHDDLVTALGLAVHQIEGEWGTG